MTNQKNRQYFKEQHKREVLWQIWLPVGFGAIAMLALGLLSAFSLQSGADASIRWGHIASIWLILPVFVTGLFVFFFLIGVIIAVGKIASILPHYAEIIQMYMQLVSQKILTLADKSVQPIVSVNSMQAALQRFWVAFRYMIFGGFHD